MHLANPPACVKLAATHHASGPVSLAAADKASQDSQDSNSWQWLKSGLGKDNLADVAWPPAVSPGQLAARTSH